jgi:hypothetical protein
MWIISKEIIAIRIGVYYETGECLNVR